MKLSTVLGGGVLAAFVPLLAQAHTPYLAPASFEPMHGNLVTLDAAFGEELFVPEVVFDNSVFAVVGPDGTRVPADSVQRLKTRAVVEHALTGKGTYRFSSGQRLGAVFRTWELDGKKESTRDPAKALPAGATLLAHYQSVNLSEAYVTLGAPTRTALAPYGNGLEIVVVTHPSDLYTGEHFAIEVRFDGAPLPGAKVEIFPATGDGRSKQAAATLTTDAAGKARFDLARAGTWLAIVRHRGKAPAGAAAPEYGYGYTLSFRVLDP